MRPTDRAGGIEGGISNGALLVARVAMKPLATLNRPVLETVDVVTKESTVSFRERTDVTAVPAMGVVAESMTALVLATEALRKFGGDSLAEVVRNRDGFVASLGHDAVGRRGQPGVERGPGQRGGMTPPHPARRDDGRRQDHDRAAGGRAPGLGLPRLRRRRRGGHRADGARALRPRRRGGLPPGRGRRARRACADPTPSVVSVAGGAVLSADNRRLIAASGIVVWLRARPETLAARVGDGAGRPLLGDDPAAALVRLDAVRAPLYAEVADLVIDVDDLAPDEVADRIVDAVDAAADTAADAPRRARASEASDTVHALSVDLAERSYPVLVGPGARHEVARFLPPGAKSAVVVTQQAIVDAGWVDGLDPGVPFEVCVIPDGEDAKTLATVEELARRFARAGLSRADVVVAVGGGIVTDVAGLRRGHLPPGHGVRERRHLAAGPGRRGHRRQDRRQPARGQEPRRRVLAAQRRAVRHRDPLVPPAARVGLRPGRDRQVRLPRRRPDGRTSRSRSRWRAAPASRRRSWPRTSARAAAA